MPQFQGKTLEAEIIWQKGDRTIWEVTLEVSGQKTKAKTYSKAVATVGFSGDIESYEKPNNQGGSDTFVKQPQKEAGYGGGGGGGKNSGDPFAMYLSYAKDVAIAMLDKDGKLDEAIFGQVLDAIVHGGNTLFEARQTGSKPAEPQPSVAPVPEPPVIEDLADLNALFPPTENG